MSIIKDLRVKSGCTQLELAKKTGLSLRTIQRLESNNKEPKGHSLIVLSNMFDIEPSEFQDQYHNLQRVKVSETTSIRLINLSVLAFLVIPFGNIYLPFLIWRNKRKSKLVDALGRKIINFQILWSTLLCLSLIISPFIGTGTIFSFPIILITLGFAVLINIIVVITTAMTLQRNNHNILNPPIRFI